MAEALDLARQAAARGDVPVGAVVVLDGRVIGRGANRTEAWQDPTAHAEILALREAARAIGSWRLLGATLYVTLEPCAMCAGACVLSRITRLVYGADDPKGGMCGSVGNLAADPRLNHQVDIVRGVAAREARVLLREFFRSRREGSQRATGDQEPVQEEARHHRRVSRDESESPADASPGARDPGGTPVLCVDLDGTLLATDVLRESLLELLRRRDRALLFLPLWLLQGRARLKREIARRVSLDPTGLPYNQPLLDFLRREKAAGRRIVLATASDRAVVDGIARHLGLFAEVLASDGRVNLAGRNKLDALLRRFGARRFDYVGNAAVDLAIWREANAAIVVTSSRRLLARIRDVVEVRQVFPTPPRSSQRPLFEALRLRLKPRR